MSAAVAVDRDFEVLRAWDANAGAWTVLHEDGRVPGRRAADEALVRVIRQVPSGPVLDAGCGGGWLVRRLVELGHRAAGIDGSPAMVDHASEAGGGPFKRLTFAEAAENPRRLEGPYGTVVFSFSLCGETVTPVLEAAASVLFPYGRVLIQTWHPAAWPGAYQDGWREDVREELGVRLPAPVPFHFRTLAGWIAELRRARLLLTEVVEPLDPDTGRPVSLILNATIPERGR